METFSALIYGDLPPVGNAISLSRIAASPPSISGYSVCWLDSGTSALALALLDIKKQRPEINRPEVILPAYCCPDLVAAAEFAGILPLVVDISPQDIAFSSDTLSKAIGPNTIALVGMTFLGIRENWPTLLPFLRYNFPTLKIIEDNAQWFPDLLGNEEFEADYLIFSFGRGKPLSLLGGGAVFSKQPIECTAIKKPSKPNRATRTAKFLTYNWLLNPHAYCLLNHNPFITLGQTTYHQLSEIRHLDNFTLELLSSNFIRYQQRSRHLERSYLFAIEEADFKSEYLPIGTSRQYRLLRYPVLCQDTHQRDNLIYQLNRQGLGASAMYKHSLANIAGVADKIHISTPSTNAEDFAGRLLTLPLHEGVKDHHIHRITTTMKQFRQ